jgi:hypothetical protein
MRMRGARSGARKDGCAVKGGCAAKSLGGARAARGARTAAPSRAAAPPRVWAEARAARGAKRWGARSRSLPLLRARSAKPCEAKPSLDARSASLTAAGRPRPRPRPRSVRSGVLLARLLMMQVCSPASRPLRAGSAGGRPGAASLDPGSAHQRGLRAFARRADAEWKEKRHGLRPEKTACCAASWFSK